MDEVERLRTRIADFLDRHRTEMSSVAWHSTHVFEAACFVIFARHYERVGYRLTPKNLLDDKSRFRYSTAGYPWNFYFFAVLPGDQVEDEECDALFEIHHNQEVAGAWVHSAEDDVKALFAVDIAVVKAHRLPRLPRGHKR